MTRDYGKSRVENGEMGLDHGKAGCSNKEDGQRKPLHLQQSYGARESATFQTQELVTQSPIKHSRRIPSGVRSLSGFTLPDFCSFGGKPSNSQKHKSRKSVWKICALKLEASRSLVLRPLRLSSIYSTLLM